MRPGAPSRTAQHNALFRALEQGRRRPLFVDPWARRFLRGPYRWIARLPAAPVAWFIDQKWPGPRAAVCVRTRYIDEAIVEALGRGLDQIVILGAGFDSRPYRLPGIEAVRVLEVDHPSTQSMKRRVVGRPPGHVTYVPCDFAREGVEDTLRAAGFRSKVRTLFVWEGVTNYLDEASVDAMLRFMSREGTEVLFTYVDRAILDGSRSFEGALESVRYVRKLNEPFTWGLDPAETPLYLRQRGLELIEDLALSNAAQRYEPAAGGPPVSAFYHVVRARCLG